MLWQALKNPYRSCSLTVPIARNLKSYLNKRESTHTLALPCIQYARKKIFSYFAPSAQFLRQKPEKKLVESLQTQFGSDLSALQ